ncbi:MAG: hypothetical protein SF029_23715 [bacterium]|nr:hypothetical protein [bacterium]
MSQPIGNRTSCLSATFSLIAAFLGCIAALITVGAAVIAAGWIDNPFKLPTEVAAVTAESSETPAPTSSSTPESTRTPLPTATPTRTPRPTATPPAFTSRDFIFDVSHPSIWLQQNITASTEPNTWTMSGDAWLDYLPNIGLCLADFSYFAITLKVPLGIDDRTLQIYYTLNNNGDFSEEHSFRRRLGTSDQLGTYFYPVQNLNFLVGDRLTDIRLDPAEGSSSQSAEVVISDFRLIRSNNGTSYCITNPTGVVVPPSVPIIARVNLPTDTPFTPVYVRDNATWEESGVIFDREEITVLGRRQIQGERWIKFISDDAREAWILATFVDLPNNIAFNGLPLVIDN